VYYKIHAAIFDAKLMHSAALYTNPDTNHNINPNTNSKPSWSNFESEQLATIDSPSF
jgi:hypothetical protein